MNDYVKNEIFMTAQYITAHGLLPQNGAVINIIGNLPLCKYLKATFEYLSQNSANSYTVYHCDSTALLSSDAKNQIFLYYIDTREQNSYALIDFKKALEYATSLDNSRFIALMMTEPACLQADGVKLAEMELCSLGNGFQNEVENTLRSFCDRLNISELRFDNIFGADIEDDGYMKLCKYSKQVLDENTVTLSPSDSLTSFSAISAVDAVDAVFTVLKYGKSANIYNASGYVYTAFEIKSYLYSQLSRYDVRLCFDDAVDNNAEKGSRALCNGKLCSLGFELFCDRDTELFYAFAAFLSERYDFVCDKVNSLYDGKIKRIRELELKILTEFDAICRENNIGYFLSGGSMLGCVRHGGFIPWDDDVDVSMLREDYEKFKRVCRDKLPRNLYYQTFENRNGYHYFFDKITINNTYFSTKYSDGFDMQKGISMDIFVFDKTSDSRFFQKLHFKRLMALRLLMNVRWINRPRKGKSYYLSKLLLPFLRIFSMDFYSRRYDKLLRKYERKNTSTLLAPSTDHKYRGVMKKEWFESLVPAKFENVDTFIPKGYDEYLKIWFGEDYMELLPVCKRVLSHDFYRLDLGEHLEQNNSSHTDYNYKGELL